MTDLDQEMAKMAAEEWNDFQPVSDVRRVYAKDGKAEHVIVVGEDDAVGTHALVPWDEWEQALDLQAASDEEDWRVHDLESDIRELQDELESVTSGARCATDLWLESWDREQAEQEWRPVSELPTWEYDGRLNAAYEVLENY